MRPMPRLRPTNPIGIAFTAYQLWRRLPPSQRKRVLSAARTHGPKVAAAILAKRKARR
ncbi:MAG: hypothetical protein QOJ43_835 [Gaiellaceae bacterium]|jgi:hypothetical protein|nr:hypothetical protein [Gaiellaceae bacterium]